MTPFAWLAFQECNYPEFAFDKIVERYRNIDEYMLHKR